MWFLSLIPGLGSLFGSINSITADLYNAKIAAINAATEQDRIAANERVLALQSRRDVLIAETAHSNIPALMQFLIAVGPAAYLLKIFIWDKVLQTYTGGSTDPLDPNLWTVVTAVVGFYFLSNAIIAGARILKA